VKEVFKHAGTPQRHMGSSNVASLFSEHDKCARPSKSQV